MPDLPTGYYRDNFDRLLTTVLARYEDLLDEDDRAFVAGYRALDEASARLLVRLYTRKGPTFRLGKLSYPEIPDLPAAADRLAAAGLVDLEPELTAGELTRLLTLGELGGLDWVPDVGRTKAALLAELDGWSETRTPAAWGLNERLIRPRHWTTLRRLQLLYFGNEYQSLTDFVLADLGLFQYEDYSLDRAARWFDSRVEIDQQLRLGELKSAAAEAREAGDVDALVTLGEALLAENWCGSARRRAHRLANRLGFRLEQWGRPQEALALFATNETPPARERRCRIHYKAGRYAEAWREFEAIEAAPRDATEARFAARFQPRLARRLKRPVATPRAPELVERHYGWPRGEGSIEQQVCARLDDAHWLENRLPLGVFGLLHWDWLFAEVPGAFHHPFQQGPADLYEPDFLARRELAPAAFYAELGASGARERLSRTWNVKAGRLNPFVHWDALERDLVLRAFDALPWAHWRAIFDHLWLDLKRHRAGFPDLFQFTDDGYRFIEVKGPGDRLQDNQRDWLAVFADAGIRAEVWYVRHD